MSITHLASGIVPSHIATLVGIQVSLCHCKLSISAPSHHLQANDRRPNHYFDPQSSPTSNSYLLCPTKNTNGLSSMHCLPPKMLPSAPSVHSALASPLLPPPP